MLDQLSKPSRLRQGGKTAGLSHLCHGEVWRLEHTAKAIQVKPPTWNGENVGLRLGNHR
jgi:hypothetical protein